MITLVLATPECLAEALATAATGTVFGQSLQLLVVSDLASSVPGESEELIATLAEMALPVWLLDGVPCPTCLTPLRPRRLRPEEQGPLLAESTHCLGY